MNINFLINNDWFQLGLYRLISRHQRNIGENSKAYLVLEKADYNSTLVVTLIIEKAVRIKNGDKVRNYFRLPLFSKELKIPLPFLKEHELFLHKTYPSKVKLFEQLVEGLKKRGKI